MWLIMFNCYIEGLLLNNNDLAPIAKNKIKARIITFKIEKSVS